MRSTKISTIAIKWVRRTVQPSKPLLSKAMPSLERPISQLVTAEQICRPEFDRWRVKLGMRPGLNRKLWEYVYIARALEAHLDFAQRPSLLGFGVGKERLPRLWRPPDATLPPPTLRRPPSRSILSGARVT